MRFIKLKSLSVRLFLTILLANLPLLVLVLYDAQKESADEISKADQLVSHLAMMAADDQERMIEAINGDLSAAANIYSVINGDREPCHQLLSDVITDPSRYQDVMVILSAGNIACQLNSVEQTINPDFLRRAFQSETLIFDLLVSNAKDPSLNPEAIFAKRFITQVGDAAIIVAILKPDWIHQSYANIAPDYPEVQLLAIDISGAIMGAVPSLTQLRGAPSDLIAAAKRGATVVRSAGLDGVSRIYGLTLLKDRPEGRKVYVAVGIPLAEVEASGDKLLRVDLLVCGLALLLSLAIARMSTQWLVLRGLQPVIQATRRMESGDLTVRINRPNNGTDLDVLAHAFDRMASTLEQRTNELNVALEKYRDLFTQSPIGLYRSTPDGMILDANGSFLRMLGLNEADVCLPIKADLFYSDPSEREKWKQIIASQGILVDHEVCLRRIDGAIIYILDNARTITDSDGQVLVYEGSMQEITNRKRMEAHLKEVNQKLCTVLDSITDAYVVWDDEWRFVEVNAVAMRDFFWGRKGEDLLGKVFWDEYPQFVDTEFYRQYRIALQEGHPVHFDAESTMNGRWWETHAYPYPGRLEVYMREITERKRAEAVMSELAYHDPLTGLLNRQAFQEEMHKALARVQRNGNKLAVFFVDLDNFKAVNDRYDHDTGDLVLKKIAIRFREVLRTEDIVSRLGGDEFTLMAEISQTEEVRLIAERIFKGFDAPIEVNGAGFQVSFSMGISIYPDQADTPELLIQIADHAMYEVKRARKDNFHSIHNN